MIFLCLDGSVVNWQLVQGVTDSWGTAANHYCRGTARKWVHWVA